MNETFEMWSAPWHALQRSLANGFAGEAAVAAAADRQPGARGAAPSAVSWLMRARHLAPQAAAHTSR